MNIPEILKNIVILLNESLEQEPLFQKILHCCISYTPAVTGALLLCDQERQEFVIKAYYAENMEQREPGESRLSMTEGISSIAVLQRQTVYVPDVSLSAEYKKIRTNVKSEVAVPLIYKNNILGVLCLDSDKTDAFHSEELELFNIIGGIAAQAIYNVSMYHSLKKTNQYRKTLIEIGQLLTEGFDLKILFHKVMDLLAHEMDIKVGILALLSESEGDLAIEVAWGLTEEEVHRGSYKIGEGITGLVAQKGETVGVKDVRREASFLGKTGYMLRLDRNRQYCFICVPLIISNQVKGALSITKEYRDKKTYESDVEFMELVSATIAKSVYIHMLFTREKRKLQQENRQLKSQLYKRYGIKNIVAVSNKIKNVLEQIEQVAQTNATVLLRGDSGTGKELFAHALHYNSPRSENPFIKINCGALPDTLLESELFGYVQGAFTGANRNRNGKFLEADRGTIFLDEIGNTSPLMQVKLLRVLQEKAFEPVGSDKTITVDVRVIGATNRDLEVMVKDRSFREDLFYRLNVVPIVIPPLRERKEDIPVLVDYFIRKYSREHGKNIRGIDPQSLKILARYNWPGNVRELENCIEYGIIFETGKYLTVESLKIPGLSSENSEEKFPVKGSSVSGCIDTLFHDLSPQNPDKMKHIINQVEKETIYRTLQQFRGNKSQSAQYLGINRLTLLNKIKKYQLDGEYSKKE